LSKLSFRKEGRLSAARERGTAGRREEAAGGRRPSAAETYRGARKSEAATNRVDAGQQLQRYFFIKTGVCCEQ